MYLCDLVKGLSCGWCPFIRFNLEEDDCKCDDRQDIVDTLIDLKNDIEHCLNAIEKEE